MGRQWTSIIFGILAVVSLGLFGCASSGDDDGGGVIAEPCEATYPQTEAATVLHVAGSCDDTNADGTAGYPYTRIQHAIDAAVEGTTIVIEAGIYAENLVLQTNGLTLVGADSGADPSELGVKITAPDSQAAAVYFSGVTDTTVRGLDIVSPAVAGFRVHEGSVTIDGCRVTGATTDDSDKFGYGLLAENVAGIWLQRSMITGSASSGVLLHGSTGEIFLEDNAIDGNVRGGIRVENVQNGGYITGNNVTGNTEFGIGLFSCVGIWLQNNGVHDTVKGGEAEAADGVIVAELSDSDGISYGPSEVVVGGDLTTGDDPMGNQITGNGRVGLLMSGRVASIIMGNNADTNGRAGIWLQRSAGEIAGIWLQQEAELGIWLQQEADAGIWLQNNGANGNTFLGISVGAGTHATVMGNAIENTEAGSLIDPGSIGNISMGDGIGVFAGAVASIEGNSLKSNERWGILGDGLDSGSSLAGNVYEGNASGAVALQGVATDAMPSGDDAEGITPAAGGSFSVLPEANDPQGFSMDVGAEIPGT